MEWTEHLLKDLSGEDLAFMNKKDAEDWIDVRMNVIGAKWTLSKKAADNLSYDFFTGNGKTYNDKLEHCIRRANDYVRNTGEEVNTKDNITKFASCIERWQVYYRRLAMINKRTDNAREPYIKVDSPIIGMLVHVSWMVKGAVFVIKKLTPSKAYLDNRKYSRLKQGKQLLCINISDLRHTRANQYRKMQGEVANIYC